MAEKSKVENSEVAEEKSNVPVVAATGTSVAVADDMSLMMEDAGSGLEHAATQDMMVPYLNILQSLSPQCQKRENTYVEGAEPGHVFNTASQRVYDGEKGIIVVPVLYQRRITEWVPRTKGGGLVRDWGMDDSVLKTTKRDAATGMDLTPEGNQITQAGTYYVLLVDPETGTFERAVLSMSGTQLKKSRRWLTMMNSLQLARPDGKGYFTPPSFGMGYKLTTVPESNDKGSWMGWAISSYQETLKLPGGKDIYLTARNFKSAIEEGIVKSDVAASGDAGHADFDDKKAPF